MRVLLLLIFAIIASASAEDAPKTGTFEIVLLAEGDSKIQTIRVVREITGMELKPAMDLVNGAPKTVKAGVTKEEGEKAIKAFDALHAKAELRDASGKVAAATAVIAPVAGKFDLILKSYPDESKMYMIKIVRDLTGLGLADSKNLVESAPVTIKSGMEHEAVQKQKRVMEQNKAVVEVKESVK